MVEGSGAVTFNEILTDLVLFLVDFCTLKKLSNNYYKLP